MDKRNSQRIRNILSGDITGKTTISIGYEREVVERKDGDIWEEDGKQWILKDGIKQTFSALSELRESLMMPLFCPKCGTIMKRHQDKKSWNISGTCLDCLIEEDTNKKINGVFEEYEKKSVEKNIESSINETKEFLEEFAKTAGSNHYITEAGDIEDWGLDQNEKNIQSIVKKQLKKLKKEDKTKK